MCEGACALKRTMQEGKSFVSSATYIINSRQQRVPITVSTSPLKDKRGKILGGVETFRDHSLVEELRRELRGGFAVGDMVSRSRAMQKIFAILPQIAESDSTVLLQGDTGTGKELMANALHTLSWRKEQPFVAINCGALPDSLLESELFGYKAGAFTNADKDKPGLFQAAGRGTILLDEIGDTSPAFQVRLLRLLEEREFTPLGGVEKVKSETRVIAATNRDLAAMVEKGEFRRDLYYRINIVRLQLPPLCQRMEDIPLLCERFIAKMNAIRGRAVAGVGKEAMAILLHHDFPGNIRELENVIEHAFILCHEGEIEAAHLPAYLTRPEPEPRAVAPTFAAQLQAGEAEAILSALRDHDYHRLATAKALGMHKSTLFRKLKKFNISLPAGDGRKAGGSSRN